jgi:hypothetical protein
MAHHPAPHHVQLDIAQAPPQIRSALDQRRVEVIPPKGVEPSFASVVGTGKLAGDQPHQLADLRAFLGIQEQMDVVGSEAVIQQGDLALGEVMTEPSAVAVPVARELEQELPVVTAVGHVEDAAVGGVQSVGPRHGETVIQHRVRLQRESQPKSVPKGGKPGEILAKPVLANEFFWRHEPQCPSIGSNVVTNTASVPVASR